MMHWLREKLGIYMMFRHIDGIKERMNEQDKKIEELSKKIEIFEMFFKLKDQQ